MKKKIKIKDFNGKTVEIEKEISAPDHLQAQIKYPKIIFKNKKRYTRKIKYKNKTIEE
ncbi:MAG: hypothetical protein J6T10_00100 [Methanobrevibacter sp.]|nr:hypothetical protein [Methanobrevibacter sp.]